MTKPKKPKTCVWKHEGNGYYHPKCKEADALKNKYILLPKEDFSYCAYCGGKIKIKTVFGNLFLI